MTIKGTPGLKELILKDTTSDRSVPTCMNQRLSHLETNNMLPTNKVSCPYRSRDDHLFTLNRIHVHRNKAIFESDLGLRITTSCHSWCGHQENMSMKCIPPHTPLLHVYIAKRGFGGVYPIFLILL